MVVVLGLIVLLVPIMRLKDFIKSEGIGLKGLFLKVESFDFSKLSQLSWNQLWAYLKSFMNVSNSFVGFEKFEVEDNQNQFHIYSLIKEIMGIVWE